MKCHVCDTTLEPEEIYHDDTFAGGFRPCFQCLAEIEDIFEGEWTEEDLELLPKTEGENNDVEKI